MSCSSFYSFTKPWRKDLVPLYMFKLHRFLPCLAKLSNTWRATFTATFTQSASANAFQTQTGWISPSTPTAPLPKAGNRGPLWSRHWRGRII